MTILLMIIMKHLRINYSLYRNNYQMNHNKLRTYKNDANKKPKPRKIAVKKQKSKVLEFKSYKCEESLNNTRLPSKTTTRLYNQNNPLRHFSYNLPEPITNSMKAILFDWLLQVSSELQLQRITLHRSLNLIDKYLQIKSIPKDQFQLLGVTSLFISHKLDQTQLIKLQIFQDLTNQGFNCQQILDMQINIYLTLNWRVNHPLPLDILWQVMNNWNNYILDTDYQSLGFKQYKNQNSLNILSILDYIMFHNIKMDRTRMVLALVYVYLRGVINIEEKEVFAKIYKLFLREYYNINSLKQINLEIQAIKYIIPISQVFFKKQNYIDENVLNQEQNQDQDQDSDQYQDSVQQKDQQNKLPSAHIQTYTSYLSIYSNFINK